MPQDMTEFTEKFQVYRHDGDCFGQVQPASMLRYAQQIAGEHAILLGLNDALYARTHTAYVLVKQALHFDRVPRVDEVSDPCHQTGSAQTCGEQTHYNGL